jgi:molybdenum cofactor guanylyltransferase
MPVNDEITGIILAGGKSSRMGSDKSNLIFHGKRLIEYPYELMKTACQQIIISTNMPGLNLPEATYVYDNYTDIGPLAGLEAALNLSNTRWNFVVPCDMPFVDHKLFTPMLKKINGFDCVALMNANGKITPLVGFFNRDILPIIIQQIKSGDYKIFNLLKKLNVRYYHTANKMVSVNFNSMADLKIFLKNRPDTRWKK